MSLKDILSLAGAILGTRGMIIVSLVIGILLGWFALGWGVAPLQWTDAAPVDLQQGYRHIYLETMARVYEADPSVDLNRMRGGDAWSDAQLSRDLNQAFSQTSDPRTQTRLANLGRALNVTVDGSAAAAGGGGGSLGGLLTVFIVVLFAALAVLLLLRLRQQRAAAPAAVGGDPQKVAAARTVYSEEETPLLQVTTSYALGEDYYDPSFSIELPSGEFLGECGVGISEAIGVDDPKKVTAFEVWLFDKSQISTVTKVLMSDYCFGDDALRSKLAPKGEPVLAQEGTRVELSTSGLRIRAKVLELEYGVGNLPPDSFVARLTVELAAWKLEGAEEGIGLAASDASF